MSMEQRQLQEIYEPTIHALPSNRLVEPASPCAAPAVRLAADFNKVPFVFSQAEAEAIASQKRIPTAEAIDQACLLHLVRLIQEEAIDGQA